MLKIDGYQILTLIHESPNSLVYRAIKVQDKQPVILKVLKQDYPTPGELTRYKQEYEITCSFNQEGVIKAYALQPYQNTLVMILEDFGGKSLTKLTQQYSLSLQEFLEIAIKITTALGEIHAANIIHKDINPSNIIYNNKTQQLKLIDFGISTRLSRENPILHNPNLLEGTLAYISPEQTGRMNRFLDYRTDFYSLGITFYELLTGQLPFSSEDILELLHCHIAKQPLLPHQIKLKIPQVLSEIVMKLMAKTAEERYQSAWGLKGDLEECLKQLGNRGQIKKFSLGNQEVYDRFQISQKLYGREREVAILLKAFERVAGEEEKDLVKTDPPDSLPSQYSIPNLNPRYPKNFRGSPNIELVLVAGYSGIGKSSLVKEIYKPITAKRGYFIAGKFDQYQRNIPYSAIIQAFKDLSKQVLTEADDKLFAWKKKILKAVGTNGQVIIEIIPEVELIIGQQPPLVDLAPTEAQKRFNLVFQDFIKVFTNPAHPLAIFLDDLQWADGGSLKLLELLLNNLNTGLLIIGTYRDNQLNPAHPFHLFIENIKKNGVKFQQIYLRPLDLATINILLKDTFKSVSDSTQALAALVEEKTGGNPFFITEFLVALYTEKLLNFNYEQKQWFWDINQVKKRNFTDNVVELMVAKIQKVPPETQEVLKLAACIGNQFELETLTVIGETSLRETAINLQKAVVEGLVQPLGEKYKIVVLEPLENEKNQVGKLKIEYQFAHDRIQQAAYSLIPDQLRQRVHLKIGQLLLQNTTKSQINEQIFDIVNQLNHGIELVIGQQQRDKIAELNLIAGQKAKSSSAYQPALIYLEQGLAWLGQDGWSRQYKTALNLYVEAAEAAYLCGNFDDIEKFFTTVLQNAKVVIDQVKAYEVKIKTYIAQQKLREAINTALTILKLLGVKLPQNPSKLDVILGLIKTKFILVGKKIDDLLSLPEMNVPTKKAAMQIINSILSAAYLSAPNLMPLLAFKGVSLSVKYGNSFVSPLMYAVYGLILCGILGEIESGYRFGNLALSVLERIKSRNVETRVVKTVNYFIRHWREHARQTLQPLLNGYTLGMEMLELEYAGYCAIDYCQYSYYIGQDLALVEREVVKYSEVFHKFKQEQILNFLNPIGQVILNLMGRSENTCNLIGEFYDESQKLQLDLEANDASLNFYLSSYKLMLCYLFEQQKEALKNAAIVEKYIDAGLGSPAIPGFYLYDSLARLRVYSSLPKSQQKRLYRKVQSNQKKLKKWAHYAPMNYLHKFYLVEAERYRILGKEQKAIDSYEFAISLAKENQYLQEEALAYELAAKFYLDQGKELITRTYLREAHYRYFRWGALAKVKDLETRYPQFLQTSERIFDSSVNLSKKIKITSTNQSSEIIDLSTVIKASQAISGEIVLEELLLKLMKILLENAGAQTGYLILEQDGQFAIETSGTVETDSITVLQSLPLLTRVPVSIINYVARSRESIICNHATLEDQFNTDPYIQQQQPKSILCTPLVNQGKLISIVYLENNLAVGAFTSQHLEIVNFLSSQAAISIENAKLYTEVRQNESRLLQLNQAFERFVPSEFLQFLNKQSIVDVQLGDQVEQEMSVLFADIRSFTTLSEKMTPEDNFRFINSYLSCISPVIREHHGFIDKYIGDAIMALFSGGADNAVKAGIAMLNKLVEYNERRTISGYESVQVGIGINTGLLMLGTVGEPNRMDGTVISDAVNLASRMEGLTKNYGVSLLITHQTFQLLQNPTEYSIRCIDEVNVKGKSEYVTLYEVFDADPPELKAAKLATLPTFTQALSLYLNKDYAAAAELFAVCDQICPQDTVVKIYLERCQELHSP